MLPTPSGRGYLLVTAGGGVFPYGDAVSSGSAHGNITIVGAVLTPDGRGYWLLTDTGRVLAFGDARSDGDVRPATAVGIAPTVSRTHTG